MAFEGDDHARENHLPDGTGSSYRQTVDSKQRNQLVDFKYQQRYAANSPPLFGEPDRTAKLFIELSTGIVHELASKNIAETEKLKAAIEEAISTR